ncbi:MAG TPA: hypothetical protein VK464_03275 [Symbiobacteriaceae bacterium]|nr:hypothetical protein [Symbiobacteriaceae bacterium]
MTVDWLFAVPLDLEWEEQRRLVSEWLAADPAAAAIDAAEAEQFFGVAYFLRSMAPGMVKRTAQSMRLNGSGSIENLRRRVTLRMLQGWRKPKKRADLIFIAGNSTMAPHPFPAEHPEIWTDEYAAQAYYDGTHLMWLVMIRRFLGRADSLLEWLEGLSDYALMEYQLYLDIARLTLRRVVYPEKAPAPPVEQVAAAAQAVELSAKTKESGALRKGVRRLEKERKVLRRQVRQQERAAAEQLAQARGEVAAAKRALQDLAGAHQRALAEQARRCEAQLAGLRAALDAERTAFAQALRALRPVNLLQGEPVTATGDPELCRLLVASVGGQFVPDQSASPDPDPARVPAACLALEQRLRDLAFRQVHILGDGLYRRKGARPGMAASAFQVRLGGVTVAEAGEVVATCLTANNFMAEYAAIALALTWLDRAGAGPGTAVELWSDCKFVVQALHRPLTERPASGCLRLGGRVVRGCNQLDTQVRRLLQRLRRRGCKIALRWVPREQVHVADRLCDRTYRAAAWYHRRQGPYRLPLSGFLQRLGAGP